MAVTLNTVQTNTVVLLHSTQAIDNGLLTPEAEAQITFTPVSVSVVQGLIRFCIIRHSCGFMGTL